MLTLRTNHIEVSYDQPRDIVMYDTKVYNLYPYHLCEKILSPQ